MSDNKNFQEPEHEIIRLNNTDVIATSSVEDFIGDGGNDSGNNNPGK